MLRVNRMPGNVRLRPGCESRTYVQIIGVIWLADDECPNFAQAVRRLSRAMGKRASGAKAEAKSSAKKPKAHTTWSQNIVEKVSALTSKTSPFPDLCKAFGTENPSLHQALADSINGYLLANGSSKKVLTPAECLFPAGKLEECVGSNPC